MKNRNKVLVALAIILMLIIGSVSYAEAGTSTTKVEGNTGCNYNVTANMVPGGGQTVAITIHYWGCARPYTPHRGQVYAFGHFPGGPEVFDMGWASGLYNTLLTFEISDFRTAQIHCRTGETVTVDGVIQTYASTGKSTTSAVASTSTKCTPVGFSGPW